MPKTSVRALVAVVILSLSGCVSQSVVVEPTTDPVVTAPPEPVDPHFEPVVGRSPEVIAALRADPAPVRAQLIEGRKVLADRQAQGALGYVHIGDSRYPADDAAAIDKAFATATRLGADRMFVYRAQKAAVGTATEFLAAYYVRFKLLFGATFRNLASSEREALGGNGVRIGSVIGTTPASQANLMAGDLVTAFNGKPVLDRVGFQESLKNAAGTSATLTLRRGDITMDRVVRLGAMPPTSEP
jgi:membrane-associated protease RseP (regulator of RpoE activity)